MLSLPYNVVVCQLGASQLNNFWHNFLNKLAKSIHIYIIYMYLYIYIYKNIFTMSFYSYSSREGKEYIQRNSGNTNQLLVSNTSFLILIKMVEKYIQVSSSRVQKMKIWKTCTNFQFHLILVAYVYRVYILCQSKHFEINSDTYLQDSQQNVHVH